MRNIKVLMIWGGGDGDIMKIVSSVFAVTLKSLALQAFLSFQVRRPKSLEGAPEILCRNRHREFRHLDIPSSAIHRKLNEVQRVVLHIL